MTLSDAPQSVIDDMEEDSRQSEDELFGGSPPASPVMRGRSPSPTLALPGTSSIVHIMQNVGTIALPGSQLDIELPVNPIALSLNPFLRPPAQAAFRKSPLSCSGSAVPSPSSSRDSSIVPSNKRKPPKSSLKRKASVLYERPPPPPIHLPDPSGPIPANFLRNQSALLGTAGLVGGVKPFNITHRSNVGSPANPIVIDDDDGDDADDERPAKRPRLVSTTSKEFPPPSNAQVVRSLVKDRDVLPLLLELLKVIARGSSQGGGAPDTAGGWNVDHAPEHEKVRVKSLVSQLMGHIRAATRKAAIKNYWFAVNGQKAKKAGADGTPASKSPGHYLPRTHTYPPTPSTPMPSTPRISKSSSPFRASSPPTLMYPSSPGISAEQSFVPVVVLNDTADDFAESDPVVKSEQPCSSSLLTPTFSPHASSSSHPPPLSAIDELLGSLLLTASPDNNIPTLEALLSDPASTTCSPNVEQWVMKTWMPIFESFPVSTQDFGNLDVGVHDSSSPMPDFTMDFDFAMLDPNPVTANTSASPNAWDGDHDMIPETLSIPAIASDPPPTDVPMPEHRDVAQQQPFLFELSQPTDMQSQVAEFPHHSRPTSDISQWMPTPDSAIDPLLLAESAQPPNRASPSASASHPLHIDTDLNFLEFSGPPSLVASPMPSMSSFGDLDLLTPTTSAWELPELAGQPDIASASEPTQDEGGLVKGRLVSSDEGTSRRAARKKRRAHWALNEDVMKIAKEAEKSANVGEVLPALISALFPKGAREVKVTRPEPVQPVASKKLSKAEILKEAHARRELLADANIKARTKLWEVTIEHAVLSQLKSKK